MWRNSKTQIVTKLKNSNCYRTQILNLRKNSKIQILLKLNNTNCDKTQKTKLWQNLITQIVTKLKNSNWIKTKNSNYDKTQKHKLWQNMSFDKYWMMEKKKIKVLFSKTLPCLLLRPNRFLIRFDKKCFHTQYSHGIHLSSLNRLARYTRAEGHCQLCSVRTTGHNLAHTAQIYGALIVGPVQQATLVPWSLSKRNWKREPCVQSLG